MLTHELMTNNTALANKATRTVFLKSLSLTLILCLLIQEFSYAAPELLKADRGWRIEDGGEKQKSLKWAKDFLPQIPESVATIEDAWVAPTKSVLRSGRGLSPAVLRRARVNVHSARRRPPLRRHPACVILIQDAHTNNSGQLNEAKLLDILYSQKKNLSNYIFLEAGSGNESLSFLRKYASLEKRQQVAKSFLLQAKLQGTEYLDLTSNHPMTLWGVEDMSLYAKSVELYRRSAKRREKYSDYLAQVENTIHTLEPTLLNPYLLAFNQKLKAHQKGELSLREYLSLLFQEAQKLELKGFKNIQLLEDLNQKEKQINFEVAQKEQALLINSLSTQTQKELQDAARSKDEQVHKAFLFLLSDQLKDNSNYPHLQKYLAYFKYSLSLNPQEILNEQKLLEQKILDSLIVTPDEKNLIQASNNIDFLKKLFLLQLTPQEYESYRKDKQNTSIQKITGFLNQKLMNQKNNYDKALFLENGYQDMVRYCEDFYELTYQRDQAFISNMLEVIESTPHPATGTANKAHAGGAGGEASAARNEELHEHSGVRQVTTRRLSMPKRSVASEGLRPGPAAPTKTITHAAHEYILITGGYHTPNLKYLLKQKNISYISLTPQVLQETNLKRYEQILLSQKSHSPLPVLNSFTPKTNMLLRTLTAGKIAELTQALGVKTGRDNGIEEKNQTTWLAENQEAKSAESGWMVKPSIDKITNRPDISLGDIFTSMLWSAGITFLSVAGWIGMNIMPSVLEAGYRPESRKSLSWVKSIRLSLISRWNNSPFFRLFGQAMTLYPFFFRNFMTSKLIFSSPKSFQEMSDLGKRMVFLIFQDFSRRVKRGVDVSLIQTWVAFEDLFPRFTRFEKLKNHINRDTRRSEAKFPRAKIGIAGDEAFFHWKTPLRPEYTPRPSGNQAWHLTPTAARLAENTKNGLYPELSINLELKDFSGNSLGNKSYLVKSRLGDGGGFSEVWKVEGPDKEIKVLKIFRARGLKRIIRDVQYFLTFQGGFGPQRYEEVARALLYNYKFLSMIVRSLKGKNFEGIIPREAYAWVPQAGSWALVMDYVELRGSYLRLSTEKDGKFDEQVELMRQLKQPLAEAGAGNLISQVAINDSGAPGMAWFSFPNIKRSLASGLMLWVDTERNISALLWGYTFPFFFFKQFRDATDHAKQAENYPDTFHLMNMDLFEEYMKAHPDLLEPGESAHLAAWIKDYRALRETFLDRSPQFWAKGFDLAEFLKLSRKNNIDYWEITKRISPEQAREFREPRSAYLAYMVGHSLTLPFKFMRSAVTATATFSWRVLRWAVKTLFRIIKAPFDIGKFIFMEKFRMNFINRVFFDDIDKAYSHGLISEDQKNELAGLKESSTGIDVYLLLYSLHLLPKIFTWTSDLLGVGMGVVGNNWKWLLISWSISSAYRFVTTYIFAFRHPEQKFGWAYLSVLPIVNVIGVPLQILASFKQLKPLVILKIRLSVQKWVGRVPGFGEPAGLLSSYYGDKVVADNIIKVATWITGLIPSSTGGESSKDNSGAAARLALSRVEGLAENSGSQMSRTDTSSRVYAINGNIQKKDPAFVHDFVRLIRSGDGFDAKNVSQAPAYKEYLVTTPDVLQTYVVKVHIANELANRFMVITLPGNQRLIIRDNGQNDSDYQAIRNKLEGKTRPQAARLAGNSESKILRTDPISSKRRSGARLAKATFKIVKDHRDTKFFDSLSHEEKAIAEKIMSGALVSTADILQAQALHQGKIFIQHREYFWPEEGRTIYLKLDSPIDGILYIRFKGVRPRVDEANKLVPYLGEAGFVKFPPTIDNQGRFTTTTFAGQNYSGTLNPKGAELEDELMRKLSQLSLPVDKALGWALMESSHDSTQQYAWVAAGMTGEDFRLSVTDQGVIGDLKHNSSDSKASDRDFFNPIKNKESVQKIFYEYGKALRELHRNGYIHRYPTFANTGLMQGSEEKKWHVVLRDLNTVWNVPESADALGSARLRFLDVSRVLHTILVHDTSEDFVAMLRSFVDGYFFDAKQESVANIFKQCLNNEGEMWYLITSVVSDDRPQEENRVSFEITDQLKLTFLTVRGILIKQDNPFSLLIEALTDASTRDLSAARLAKKPVSQMSRTDTGSEVDISAVQPNQPAEQPSAVQETVMVGQTDLHSREKSQDKIFLKKAHRQLSRMVLSSYRKTAKEWGARRFILREGMKFGDLGCWWREVSRFKSHREQKHGGIDLAVIESVDGKVEAAGSGRPVFSLIDGKVKWIFEDDMQSTVIMETTVYGRKLYTVYTHIVPAEGLKQGDSVRHGKNIGKIGPSRNKSIIAPHLHQAIFYFRDEAEADRLQDPNYDIINQMAVENKIIYIDPADLIPASERNKIFVSDPTWETTIESVALIGEPRDARPLRREIFWAIPGIKRVEDVPNPASTTDITIEKTTEGWALHSADGEWQGDASSTAEVLNHLIQLENKHRSGARLALRRAEGLVESPESQMSRTDTGSTAAAARLAGHDPQISRSSLLSLIQSWQTAAVGSPHDAARGYSEVVFAVNRLFDGSEYKNFPSQVSSALDRLRNQGTVILDQGDWSARTALESLEAVAMAYIVKSMSEPLSEHEVVVMEEAIEVYNNGSNAKLKLDFESLFGLVLKRFLILGGDLKNVQDPLANEGFIKMSLQLPNLFSPEIMQSDATDPPLFRRRLQAVKMIALYHFLQGVHFNSFSSDSHHDLIIMHANMLFLKKQYESLSTIPRDDLDSKITDELDTVISAVQMSLFRVWSQLIPFFNGGISYENFVYPAISGMPNDLHQQYTSFFKYNEDFIQRLSRPIIADVLKDSKDYPLLGQKITFYRAGKGGYEESLNQRLKGFEPPEKISAWQLFLDRRKSYFFNSEAGMLQDYKWAHSRNIIEYKNSQVVAQLVRYTKALNLLGQGGMTAARLAASEGNEKIITMKIKHSQGIHMAPSQNIAYVAKIILQKCGIQLFLRHAGPATGMHSERLKYDATKANTLSGAFHSGEEIELISKRIWGNVDEGEILKIAEDLLKDALEDQYGVQPGQHISRYASRVEKLADANESHRLDSSSPAAPQNDGADQAARLAENKKIEMEDSLPTNSQTLQDLKTFFTEMSLPMPMHGKKSMWGRLAVQQESGVIPIFNLRKSAQGLQVRVGAKILFRISPEEMRMIKETLKKDQGRQSARRGQGFLIERMQKMWNEQVPGAIGTGFGFVEIDLAQLVDPRFGSVLDLKAKKVLLKAIFDRVARSRGNQYILLNIDQLPGKMGLTAQRRLARIQSKARMGQVLTQRPEGAVVSRIVLSQAGDKIEKLKSDSVVALLVEGLPNTGIAFLEAETLAGLWSAHAGQGKEQMIQAIGESGLINFLNSLRLGKPKIDSAKFYAIQTQEIIEGESLLWILLPPITALVNDMASAIRLSLQTDWSA